MHDTEMPKLDFGPAQPEPPQLDFETPNELLPTFVQLTDTTWVAADHITKMEQVGPDAYVYLTRSDAVCVRNCTVPVILERIRTS